MGRDPAGPWGRALSLGWLEGIGCCRNAQEVSCGLSKSLSALGREQAAPGWFFTSPVALLFEEIQPGFVSFCVLGFFFFCSVTY